MRGELVTSPHDKNVWKREVVQNYFKKQPSQESTFIKKAELCEGSDSKKIVSLHPRKRGTKSIKSDWFEL